MSSTLRPVDVVVNPAARGGRLKRVVERTRRAFHAAGFSPQIHCGTDATQSTKLIESLVAAQRERIIIVGGDGMVHLAANAMVGSASALGIIGAGSGNDAARALGLPTRLPEAVGAALGAPVPVDVLVAGHTVAVTVATGGFTGTVNARANDMVSVLRPASYLLATLAELPRLQHRRVALDIDGGRWELDCALLAVANSAFFGGGMKVAPTADPFDGILNVVVAMGSNRVKYARLLPQVFSGAHIGDSYVLELTGRSITITPLDEGEPLMLWADGEPWTMAPIKVACRPGALLIAGAENNR